MARSWPRTATGVASEAAAKRSTKSMPAAKLTTLVTREVRLDRPFALFDSILAAFLLAAIAAAMAVKLLVLLLF